MSMSRFFALLVAAVMMVYVPAAHARDWFVSAGSDGNGTKEKPFGDPFEALEKCEANDVIHITEGRYVGKLQVGSWKIPFEGVQLLGGYSKDWSERDPWKHMTMLVWDRNSKNQPLGARIEVTEKGAVLDGLVLDGVEQNEYQDEKKSGREQRSLDKSDEMVQMALPGTVRNCVFLNTGRQGLVCPVGTTIENNLFMNTFDSAIKINSLPPEAPESKVPAAVKNNTILWSWDDRAAGKGGYQGTGIYMSGPATITNNIFAFCDNNGIYCVGGVERSTVSNNLFFMNKWANFKLGQGGKDALADDKSMDLMEEMGLKGFEGNKVGNPGLALDKDWMEGTTKRTLLDKGKVEMDDMNNLRQTLGMDLRGTGGAGASGVAPAYDLTKAMALMTPKDEKTGARMVKLEAKFSGPSIAGPAKNYEKKELTAWADNPDSVDGKPLEMVVAISNVANVSGIPSPYKPDDYEGIFLHDANGQMRVTGFYKKGSSVNRTVNEGAGMYDGNGKADRLYTVTGVAYVMKSIPKAGFLLESIVPFEGGTAKNKRAVGRDWFVRAGATGGDGSKDKPFRDPYQALEKVEAGDTIHVAGGEYVGKLRAGRWTVDCKDIEMLGGYDKDFAVRDPWKNPTLLYCPEDFKGTRGGYTLQGDQDHSNFILDGFVFDKKLNNQYDDKGNLMYGESEKSEHIWLADGGCVVRNCVFINGAEGAARLCSGQTIENCIFLNHHTRALKIERGKSNDPVVIRNNTFAFSWEKRFGQGHGIMADLLILEANVRAVIDSNIFEFADQHALRINGDPKDIELTNNVFDHNLFAEVFQTTNEQFIDNKNFGDLKQLGWKKLEGNVMKDAGLPVDEKWFNTYLTRTAYTPGKVEMNEWNQIREILGQPMIATGGEPGTGLAPAYDRAKAMAFFPKVSDIKAGARPVALTVKFEGVAKAAESHEYTETTWDVAKSRDEWDKLNGKRVSLKVAIKAPDVTYSLDDIKEANYSAYSVGGPEGLDSGGLPMRVYVPKGTRLDRMFQQAKGYETGKPDETHIIKGVVRENRTMVIEAVEKAD